tara:strand:+ start:1014 stop:1232 length:219 start_codon:yes stop_codon:yes gene_type:complete
MWKALRAAMKYGAALPAAIDLLEEVHRSVRDDGTINRKERAALMSKFWKLVQVVQGPRKKAAGEKLAAKKAA